MKVDKIIETPSGEIHFQGTLSPEEVEVVVSVGLNFLVQQGAIPFKVLQPKDRFVMTEGSELEQ